MRLTDLGGTGLAKLARRVVDAADDRNTSRLAILLRARLTALAQRGELWAARALDDLELEGARRYLHAFLKAEDRSTIRFVRTGEVVSAPTSYGVRRRDGDGRRLRLYQQTLWFEMSWDDFAIFVRTLSQQLNILDARLKAFREIERLRDKHPDTRTPGEACEREGINPRAFEVAS